MSRYNFSLLRSPDLSLIVLSHLAVQRAMRSLFYLERSTFVLLLLLLVSPSSRGNGRWTESVGEDCSEDDVAVYQGDMAPLPSGIPAYSVQIINKCLSGCAIANIHVSCRWFSSARQINPRVFRRIDFDDCLVNDGAAIPAGGSISFEYANSFRYPLAISNASCYLG